MGGQAKLVGQRFGRLTVIEGLEMTPSGRVWLCSCDCGGTREIGTSALKRTETPGCKCCETERRADVHSKHAGSRGGKTKLYMVWKCMHSRCRDPGNTSWDYYGAKGIKVCAEWRDFAVFRDWALSHGYQEGLTIDRATSTCDYCPAHCEWITGSENSQRTKTNKHRGALAEALLAA